MIIFLSKKINMKKIIGNWWRNTEARQENIVRQEVYDQMEKFVTKTLPFFYNIVTKQTNPQIDPNTITNIQTAITGSINYLNQKLSEIGNHPEHPVYFFCHYLINALNQFQPNIINPKQMAQQLLDLAQDMKATENRAAQDQKQAAEQWKKQRGRGKPTIPQTPQDRTAIQNLITQNQNNLPMLNMIQKRYNLSNPDFNMFLQQAKSF